MKTLSKIWLAFVAFSFILGNGWLCYEFHELLAYEGLCLFVTIVLYLTVIAWIEVSEED